MNTASQLPLHNIPKPSQEFDINRLDTARKAVDPAPARGSAESVLAARVVDDRVFHMGMTNWKAVIDRAIFLGHTELFDSEFSRQGLRKHGYRYSPVPLLPERAVEYVKSRTLLIGAGKLSKKMRDQLGCITDLAKGKKLKSMVSHASFELCVLEGDHQIAVQVLFEQVAFSDGRDVDDIKVLGKSLSVILKRQATSCGLILKLAPSDVTLLGQCVHAQLVNIRGLSAWNA